MPSQEPQDQHVSAFILSTHHGLVSGVLDRLGRINVICGKNNSGKTTVLEAIERNPTVGVVFGADDLFDVILEGCATPDGVPRKISWGQMRGALEEISTSKKHWVPADWKSLQLALDKKVRVVPCWGDLGVNWEAIRNSYDRRFPRLHDRVLIPAKRRLHEAMAIGNKPISPTGENVVEYLFKLGNQLSVSPEQVLYGQVVRGFEWITDGHSFEITMEGNTLQLYFKHPHGSHRKAQVSGLGLRDLLIILAFAVAEDQQIVLVEEPENHIHPDMQRRLIRFLKNETDKQYFFATHSNVFLDHNLVDRVIFTTYDGEVRIFDETSRAALLRDLGYSVVDNLRPDLIVFLEGSYDKPVIEKFLDDRGLSDRYALHCHYLCGDVMDHLDDADVEALVGGARAIALLDRDPGSEDRRKKFKALCKEHDIPVHELKRLTIEHYFTMNAIRAGFQGKTIKEGMDSLDPDVPIRKQLGADVKRQNRSIVKHMSWEDIEGTDLGDFFVKIESMLAS